MSGKPRKPPLDKKSIVARLEHAQEQQLLVHVRRWIPHADRIEGFVVGVSKKWVAFQRLSDGMTFDGWVLLRLKDIQAVSTEPDPDSFEVKALKARGQWPPSMPELNLDDAVEVLRTAAGVATVVSVFDEFDLPDVCWIGSVALVNKSKLRLLEVNTRGGWARKTRAFTPDDITRVDVGGGYEEALLLVAGEPPAV